jgi:uncharacterized protein YneF (UPF0154 family)
MTTIIIATLVVWTIFGFFVLFNSIEDLTYSKTNLFKLALALGPVIFFAGIIGGAFLIAVHKTVSWLKQN